MDEAVNAFAALRDLDAAMYRQQTELARGFGFVVEPPPEEVGMSGLASCSVQCVPSSLCCVQGSCCVWFGSG